MKSNFKVIPAIDLKGGQCVRLRQGQADKVTVYDNDPLKMARYWVAQGAEALHIVDLDGAFSGKPAHTDLIKAMIAAIDIPVSVGGGLRSDEDLQRLVDAGAGRVIIGTRALADPLELQRLAQKFGHHLTVGIDARNGKVQVKGWTETTALTVDVLAEQAVQAGVQTIIYTDTATDGMLTGPNFISTKNLCEKITCDIIASGGVAGAADVKKLAQWQQPNLIGVIVGNALYDQVATFSELHFAAKI